MIASNQRVIPIRITGTTGPAPFNPADVSQCPAFGVDPRMVAVLAEQGSRQLRRGEAGRCLDQAFNVVDKHAPKWDSYIDL